MTTQERVRTQLRALPSVERLRQVAMTSGQLASAPAAQVTRAARQILSAARAQVRQGHSAPEMPELVRQVVRALGANALPRLRSVINATGIILHTNIGRAPLSEAALEQVMAVARGYSNLELDLDSGSRGSRLAPLGDLFTSVTSADAGVAVNNNAAAVLLVLSAIASDGEVIVSRGELVEIGGGFRIPDVMRQSGARLVEVGTTNRTRVADYRAAITPETRALLAVHPSNFRVIGFTESAPLSELAALAHEHGVPMIYDLGSGSPLDTATLGIAHEPTPQEAIAAGADLVCFSGDKLLGGPQAGIVVGRSDLIARLRSHPLMRALRLDKMTLAALEVTLRAWATEQEDTLPVVNMLRASIEDLAARAETWASHLRAQNLPAATEPGFSAAGGGSLPGEQLPTTLCVLDCDAASGQVASEPGAQGDIAAKVAHALRIGSPSVITRVSRGQILLDPRTVSPGEDDTLLSAVVSAFGSVTVTQAAL
ncbi:MAG TPA: L-seryl-tRNA(Sec) selenium transferase [Ktedonobacterales bacterium]